MGSLEGLSLCRCNNSKAVCQSATNDSFIIFTFYSLPGHIRQHLLYSLAKMLFLDIFPSQLGAESFSEMERDYCSEIIKEVFWFHKTAKQEILKLYNDGVDSTYVPI